MFLSIRYKFLAIMLILLVSAIMAFLYLATDLFNSDKKAYIYDNNAALTEALAKEAETSLMSVVKSMRFVGITFSRNKQSRASLVDSIRDIFKSEEGLIRVAAFEVDKKSLAIKRIAQFTDSKHLTPHNFTESQFSDFVDSRPFNVERVLRAGVAVSGFSLRNEFEVTHVNLYFPSKDKDLIISSYLVQALRFRMFERSRVYSTYMVSRYGRLLAHTDRSQLRQSQSVVSNDIVRDIIQSQSLAGATEYERANGAKHIVAYRKLAGLGLTVFSEIPSQKAFAASQRLIEKSVLFAILILSISFVLSVPFTRSLTKAIRRLYLGTTKVAEGDFEVNIPVKSNDEIGSLSQAFNKMTGEISRLIKETVEKARMEREIETAQIVQDNFIPENYIKVGGLEIASFFKPASECGGDWWGYQKSKNAVTVMLGDATGHGVGPALITSAVHSCNETLSWLEEQSLLDEMGPAQIMKAFNAAVCKAGKGKIKMTFFIARINLSSGEITYANASHEVPVSCPEEPKGGEKLRMSDLEALTGEPGPILGQNLESTYKEYSASLGDKAKLVIYTDGLIECCDENNDEFGENRFFRSLFKSVHLDVNAVKDTILKKMHSFIGDRPFEDDVTFLVISNTASAVPEKKVG